MASIEETLEDAVVARLLLKVPTAGTKIYASASEDADVKRIAQQPPVILVQCTGSTPDELQPKGAAEQRRRVFTIAVKFIAEDLRVTEATRATVGIHDLKQKARQWLQGFRPAGGSGGMEEGDEQEQGIYPDTKLLVWQQDWTVPGIVNALT